MLRRKEEFGGCPKCVYIFWTAFGSVAATSQVRRMHPSTLASPVVNALARSGENLLVDKTTGTRYPAAPTGSLLLTSAPFGWPGIIVEQHRLPPAEMPEHSILGHGISVNVGAQPTSFAWTRGRNRWDDQADQPWSLPAPDAW